MNTSGAIPSIGELFKAVDLLAVRALEIETRLVADPPGSDAVLAYDLNTKLTTQPNWPSFAVVADYQVFLRAQGAEANFLEARIKLVAAYRLTEQLEPPPELLREFAETQGMFHLWPYLRTHLAVLAGLLGIAPPTLPVFRAPVKRSKAADPGD